MGGSINNCESLISNVLYHTYFLKKCSAECFVLCNNGTSLKTACSYPFKAVCASIAIFPIMHFHPSQQYNPIVFHCKASATLLLCIQETFRVNYLWSFFPLTLYIRLCSSCTMSIKNKFLILTQALFYFQHP